MAKKACAICGKPTGSNDEALCPECRTRLMRVLYPDLVKKEYPEIPNGYDKLTGQVMRKGLGGYYEVVNTYERKNADGTVTLLTVIEPTDLRWDVKQ